MNSTQRDLTLVLVPVRDAGAAPVAGYVQGSAVELADAVGQAARLLGAAAAPAIIGLEYLTIEAARQAVLLAQTTRSQLFPHRPIGPVRARQAVTCTMTLDQARRCDVWIRVGAADDKLNQAEQYIGDGMNEAHPNKALVKAEPATLDVVLQHRAAAADDAGQWLRSALKPDARSVVVTLAHDGDARVVSQWHKLAADVQQHVRMAVIELAGPDAANARGADEVVTWMTGRSLADLSSRSSQSTDVAVTIGPAAMDAPQRISIAGELDSGAPVSFVTPGLASGLAARVMRFDGAMLWLCSDPGNAPPDPAVQLLADLRQAIGTRP